MHSALVLTPKKGLLDLRSDHQFMDLGSQSILDWSSRVLWDEEEPSFDLIYGPSRLGFSGAPLVSAHACCSGLRSREAVQAVLNLGSGAKIPERGTAVIGRLTKLVG